MTDFLFSLVAFFAIVTVDVVHMVGSGHYDFITEEFWCGGVQLIALKDGPGKKLLIDVETYPGVRCLGDLSTDAGSVMELYKCCADSRFVNQYWRNVVLDPTRSLRQERLRSAILDHADASVLLERSSSVDDFTDSKDRSNSSDEDLASKAS